MKTKEVLLEEVEATKAAYENALYALKDFESLKENNVFASLKEAQFEIEDMLINEAVEDCKGSGNCGSPEYSQEFMVGDKSYIGKIIVEYNRHDKQYYYIEEYNFSYEEIKD